MRAGFGVAVVCDSFRLYGRTFLVDVVPSVDAWVSVATMPLVNLLNVESFPFGVFAVERCLLSGHAEGDALLSVFLEKGAC